MSDVRVWEEQVVIPTYPVGKPEKQPMFLEHRVYQGASGRVYPHTVIESVSDEKQNRSYRALCLENEYLYVMVLPELGGRVQRALDKTNGYDFVYYNEVIKPAMVGLAGPWISGGIEFNWPQHHRPSTFDPVEGSILQNPDGSASILVGETETMYRTRAVSRMTLYPGKAYLEITSLVYNGTEQPQTFLWWANPAVAVGDHTRSIFPPDVCAVMDHGKRDVSDFPIAHGVYYKMDYSSGVDISRYKNIPVPTSYMAAHSDFDFLGNYDDERGCGLLHVADHHVSPGKKQWTWGCGEFGQAWDRNLTDENGPYIELMTGCFTDNQPDFTWLMPRETKRFTQVFMPYKGVGQVQNATRDAVVGVERAGERAEVRVYATSRVQGAVIRVKSGETAPVERTANLSPEDCLIWKLEQAPPPVTVTVQDAKGRMLVKCTEYQQQEQPLPKPAEAIPAPEHVETVDKLYLYGTHLEQYHHATWDAADYFLEGLRRDPDDVRLNDAYARLLMKRGLVAESLPYLRHAVSAATVKNPNPMDGQCLYDLGVALDFLGKEDEAYDAFYKAAWCGAWQSAAYERVGAIDIRRGEWNKAKTHLQEAICHGPENLAARNALATLLRLEGCAEEACAVAAETLQIDPMDAISRQCFAKEGERADAAVLISPNPAIEVAIAYAQAGFPQEAVTLLAAVWARAPYPLLAWHLAYFTGDIAWAQRAEEADQAGCFPHRIEDERAIGWCIARMTNAPMAHHALGCYWYDKQQYQRATVHWETAVRDAPNFPTAHRNLALAYYNKQRRPQEALTLMQRAFALDEGDARILMELELLMDKLHLPVLERFMLLDSHRDLVEQRDDLRLKYAALLNQQTRFQEALHILEARRFHPWEGGEGKVPAQWRIALIMQARTLMARGAHREALPLLEKAAGPYPHNLGEGRLPMTRENDALYWLGLCRKALGEHAAARRCWEQGALGDTTPTGMLYYNDQPPEMIFYQGLCLRRLGCEEEAAAVFAGLRRYAQDHRDDKVRTEYFAVSLPDLAIFDENLTLRNRAHCLLIEALGAIGLGDHVAAAQAKAELLALCPESQSVQVHLSLTNA